MKIALISDGIYPYVIGGMQKHSASLGVELVKLGFSVDLYHCVPKGDSIPLIQEVNLFHFQSKIGFNKTFCSHFPNSIRFPGHYLWNSFKYSRWVFDTIIKNQSQYDFIYTKGFSSWKLLNNRRRLKFVTKVGVKFHGYEMYQFSPNLKIKMQHFMLRPFVKKINNKADYVFSYGGKITHIIKDLGVPNNKIIEIPSAIDQDWIIDSVDLNSDAPKFLFIGRDERRKGMVELCDTLVELDKLKLFFEIHFIGPIKEVNQLKLSNIKVIYHGLVISINTKKRIIDNCDVLICPSYSEGMPNVIIESMARGLAIIATNVGANELLVDNSNGLLLEKPDKIELIKAMLYFSNLDSKILNLMKLSSIDKVNSSFLWEVVSKNLLSKIS